MAGSGSPLLVVSQDNSANSPLTGSASVCDLRFRMNLRFVVSKANKIILLPVDPNDLGRKRTLMTMRMIVNIDASITHTIKVSKRGVVPPGTFENVPRTPSAKRESSLARALAI
jgi:hypothetical protein